MPRKLSEDSIYASELGIDNRHNGKRLIKRLGGALKLRSLSPEARNILLARSGLRDENPQKVECQ